jgi:hypothetical protein
MSVGVRRLRLVRPSGSYGRARCARPPAAELEESGIVVAAGTHLAQYQAIPRLHRRCPHQAHAGAHSPVHAVCAGKIAPRLRGKGEGT